MARTPSVSLATTSAFSTRRGKGASEEVIVPFFLQLNVSSSCHLPNQSHNVRSKLIGSMEIIKHRSQCPPHARIFCEDNTNLIQRNKRIAV